MITYRKIQSLKKYICVDKHAIDRFIERFEKTEEKIAKEKLRLSYLRGKKLDLPSEKRIYKLLNYPEEANYYKYGDIVIVVTEKGERYSRAQKMILTCYHYKNSIFDLSVDITD